jgi:hypothetical protein
MVALAEGGATKGDLWLCNLPLPLFLLSPLTE